MVHAITDWYSKSFKVMQVKERMRNCHLLEETKDLHKLNAMWGLGLDPGQEKWHSGELMKFENGIEINLECGVV